MIRENEKSLSDRISSKEYSFNLHERQQSQYIDITINKN